MSTLALWLDHRMDVVGIDQRKDLAEYSGLQQETIHDLFAYGRLGALNRSERRSLAGSLRVSLRKLEQLDEGAIEWIEDRHVYDAGMPGRPLPSQENDPAYWMPKEANPEDRGTPLVGSIRSSGQAEPDEDWQEEWGRHIPQRFGKGHNVYALELASTGQAVVFRNVPPWEFREGPAAAYCWNGWESQGWFGQLRLQSSSARLVTADGVCHDLEPVNLVRIGKVVGRWPPLPIGERAPKMS
jgi:hypothetical protein